MLENQDLVKNLMPCALTNLNKALIKSKETASNNQFSDSFNDALLRKNMTAFWSTWRSKFGGKNSLKVSWMVSVMRRALWTVLPRSLALHALLTQKPRMLSYVGGLGPVLHSMMTLISVQTESHLRSWRLA